MKYTRFFLIFACAALFVCMCSALYFQLVQKSFLNKTLDEYYFFQEELKTLEADLAFLEKHQNELNFLIKKGWFSPCSRLIGGEKIKQSIGSVNAVHFTIEPETIKEIGPGVYFKMSKILIELSELSDKNIYEFVVNVLKNFPGVLILRKFSLRRNEKINETNLLALSQHKRPNFVVGEIVYEWFAMGAEQNGVEN